MKKNHFMIISGIIAISGFVFFSAAALKQPLMESYYSCRYAEETHLFCFDVMGYIEKYYRENQKYPPQIDVQQFRLYSIEPFRPYLDTLQYQSTQDSYVVIWSYPRVYKGSELLYFKCTGTNGTTKYDWYDKDPNGLERAP